jgi:hypothetical protein
MEKKAKAKAAMLEELKNEMSNESYSPMKEMMGKKGMKKVSVMSDSPEGLKKGLSMAEKLMQLKSKQKEEEMPESEDEMEESPEMEAMDDLSEMSNEEKMAMFELLKKELGKA